jgi:hypothetical protein
LLLPTGHWHVEICVEEVGRSAASIIMFYCFFCCPGNLVVVSHGSPISAIHFALSGQLDYMGQCTISHYRLHWPQKVADENLISSPSSSPTLFPMSGGGPLPLPCKSIVIRALPPKRQLLKAVRKTNRLSVYGPENIY